jgi:hypothetical protein
MQDTQRARKCSYISNVEKYHTLCTQENKQIHKVLLDLNSLISEAVYNHFTTQWEKYFSFHAVDSSIILSRKHVNLLTRYISTIKTRTMNTTSRYKQGKEVN